jgi:hypothetical protein
MALFGGRNARTATNAPRHWPEMTLDWSVKNPAYHYLKIAADLATTLGETVQLSLYQDLLYDDGLVRVPIIVESGGERTAIFAYPDVDDEACAHYSGVRALLRQREQMAAVYYAAEAMRPVKPGSGLERLDTTHFSLPDAERPDGDYALWWPTPEDPLLRDSPALSALDAWFEALDGYASYLFSSFVAVLELAGEGPSSKVELYALPDQPHMVAIDGPAELEMYLHASMAQGLWLAFDTRATSAVQRNRLLKIQALSARDFRAAAEAQRTPPMPAEAGRALPWWRGVRADMLQREAAGGGAGLRIGSIVEEGRGRTLAASVSTEEERRTRGAQHKPGDLVLRWAGEALGRALESAAAPSVPEAELPAPDEPNPPPSISPELRMWRGEEMFTTVFFFTPEPDAVAATPAAIAERAPIDVAVLVCDGFVREGDQRVDALYLRAQQRGEPHSHVLIQRYRPRRRGQAFARLGNWVQGGLDASIFPPEGGIAVEAPAAAGRPSEAVQQFATYVQGQLLKWIGTGDPSGASLYREGEPLFSPVLYLRTDDGVSMTRFAMSTAAEVVGIAGRKAAESGARVAAFVYDDVFQSGGASVRELRFRVQERGAPRSFVYGQRYETPVEGKPFTTTTGLELVAVRESLAGPEGAPAPPAAPPPPTPPPVPAPPGVDAAAAAAERRRIELSRATGASGSLVQPVGSAMRMGYRAAGRKEAGEPVDRLRFAVFRCEITPSGLAASDRNGAPRTLSWGEIASVSVRQLPNDPPWESAIVVDVVPAGGAPPLRLVTGTFIAFQALPEGASTSPMENVRRLCRHIRTQNPAVGFDEATARFCEAGPCPRVLGMRQWAEYDSRFP